MERELIFKARREDFRVDTFRSGGKEGQNQTCAHSWEYGNLRQSDGVPRSRMCRKCGAYEYSEGGVESDGGAARAVP